MYNPYSIRWQAGEHFEIVYKNDNIVSEGRQKRAIAEQICDLLNGAFTLGVREVQAQANPVLDAYRTELDALKLQLLVSSSKAKIGPIPDEAPPEPESSEESEEPSDDINNIFQVKAKAKKGK